MPLFRPMIKPRRGSRRVTFARGTRRIKRCCSRERKRRRGNPRERNYNLQEDAIIHETSLQSGERQRRGPQNRFNRLQNDVAIYLSISYPCSTDGYARPLGSVRAIFSCLPAFHARGLLGGCCIRMLRNVKRRDLRSDNVFDRVCRAS